MSFEMMNMVGNAARVDQIEMLNRELREQQAQAQAQPPQVPAVGVQMLHPGENVLMARDEDFPWYFHMRPNFWRRRSLMEKILLVFVFALSITLVSVCVGLLNKINALSPTAPPSAAINATMMPSAASALHRIEKHNYDHFESFALTQNGSIASNTCLTPGCVKAAAAVLAAMDSAVEPCDDFYHFACGGYVRETVIPDDRTALNLFTEIGDKLNEQIRVLIDKPALESEATPFRMAKHLYKACMNKTLIEQRGLQPLIDQVEAMGGWPVVRGDQWNEANWTWQKSVSEFRHRGFSMDYFFDFSIGIDLRNSTERIIDFDQTPTGISREFLIDGIEDKVVRGYYDYMVDMAVIYGADRERAVKEMRDVIDFEMAVANISVPNEERRNASVLYNRFKISEADARFPYFGGFRQYINVLMPATGAENVTDNETIVIAVPDFLDRMGKLLAATPNRTLANYAFWRMTAFSSFFLTDAVRARQLKFSSVISGKQENDPRWKECVEVTTSSMPVAIGALYVRHYFQESAKVAATEMVGQIRKEFVKILKAVPWMDDETRSKALIKVAAMAVHIGYPEELLDDAKLTEHYDGLVIDENQYLEDVMTMNRFGSDVAFNKLRKPVNKTDWVSHGRPAVVNAFYSSIENSIQFPAGILQGQFFSASRPRYMNYGAIGFVMGHEITHGFDDQGRQFDVNGNLFEWWKPETREKFKDRAQCIIYQYGNYTEQQTGLKLNGINTQGENIADNGGIKQSYQAYQTWVKENHPEKTLPGLPYTQQQMFWVSAAQTWCNLHRAEAMKGRILTGVHSPGEFRVLGPLRNMPAFAKDFNCPLGSPMNPVKKCEVW